MTTTTARATLRKAARPRRAATPAPAAAKRGAASLSIEMATVGADDAREWLSRNKSNRSLRKRRLIEFRRDMIGGNWRDVGDPIRFDTNDDLIDGQHRLAALVAADEEVPGVTANFIIVRGVAPEDRHVIDTGTRRTAADQLKMAGYANWNYLAAASRWAILYERRVMYSEAALKTVTHSEILDYVRGNPRFQELVGDAVARLIKHIDMPGGYVCAAYYLCSQVDAEQAEDFFYRLKDGVGLSAGDPILLLRNRLRDLDKQRVNLPGEAWLSLLFRAWNHRREGKTLRALPAYKSNGAMIPCPELR